MPENAPKPRRYSQNADKCPVHEAVRFLAGAWTVEIYWNLSSEPLRFGELKRRLPGVSAKVLTQRLRELEELGCVVRTVHESSPPSVEYRLTTLGRRFIPILESIAQVGGSLLKRRAG